MTLRQLFRRTSPRADRRAPHVCRSKACGQLAGRKRRSPPLRRRALLALTLMLSLLLMALPVAAWQQPRAAEAPPPAEPTSGSITGRIVDEAGRPIPYAPARASVPGSMPGGGFMLHSDSSDAEGNFSIDNLAPALYQLDVGAPGYVPAPDESGEMQPRYYRVGDFVTLRMIRGAIITGRVTNSNDQPVVAVTVRPYRIRDAEGRPLRIATQAGERPTDDRGIYRFYGLLPGTYLIAAGGSSGQTGMRFDPYHGDAPTYYPSSARSAAAEVVVRSGEEAAGIDIRYRGERGRIVSGTVAGGPPAASPYEGGVSVSLYHADSGTFFGYSGAGGGETGRGFAFYGVPDGDYLVVARSLVRGDTPLVSADTRRITVRGADITNLELRPAPLASLAGRVVIESERERLPACEPVGDIPVPEAALLRLRRDEQETTAPVVAPPSPGGYAVDTIPRAGGEFSFRNLEAGRYRLLVRALDEDLYVRSFTLPAPAAPRAAPAGVRGNAPAAPAAPRNPPARDGFALGRSEQITGLTVTLARGAAALSGRVATAAAADAGETERAAILPLPARLRVYLVPAERERADETLHYYETAAQPDGTFAFTHLAPGRYFILARPAPEHATGDAPWRPLAWDAEARAQLRRAAASANLNIELQSCQRLRDYSMRYAYRE